MQDATIGALDRKPNQLKDKTAGKNKQRETPTSNAKLVRRILETMPVGLLILQTPGKIAFANQRLSEILGYRTDQLTGQPLDQIVYPDDRNDVSHYAMMGFAGKSPRSQFIFRSVTQDNRFKSLRAQAVTASWADRPVLILFVDDISKTKLSLMPSGKHNEMLCTLFDIVPISTALVTWQEGRFVEANPSFYENTGYQEEDVIGRTIVEIGLWLDPEERSSVMRIISDNGLVKSFPIRFRIRNGKIHDCIFSAQLVEFNEVPCTLEVYIDMSAETFPQADLTDKKRTISEQTKQIQDLKAALKVVIDHRESEKNEPYHNLLLNLKKFTFPYLDKIKTGKMDNTSRTYLSMLEFNLNDLIGSLPDSAANPMQELTFTETQVANLIRQGKSSKEIAQMLNVSPAAISFHRHNLRKKMGLVNKKTTLRAHLQSLAK